MYSNAILQNANRHQIHLSQPKDYIANGTIENCD
jgi:hypothetical protein